VRLEREKLSSKEARLAGLEAALEATRREMDRQAAEVAAGMQVGRLAGTVLLGLTGIASGWCGLPVKAHHCFGLPVG
jgi:hypothetical protein